MVALLIATTLAWSALEAASSRAEPASRWTREHAGALTTGLALLVVHATAIGEHVLWGAAGSPAGLALIAIGVTLRIAAIRTLGDDFVSMRTVPRRRVTTGVYRWVRHPSELGLVLAAMGAAVLLGSRGAAVVVLVVLVPLSLQRCRAEDRLLAGHASR